MPHTNRYLTHLQGFNDARLMFVGDLHGSRTQVLRDFSLASEQDVDAIIAAGDFGVGFDLTEDNECSFINFVQELVTATEIPIFFIDGNHENFEWLETWTAYDEDGIGIVYTKALVSGVFHISRGGIIEIAGRTIMGFGGAISVDRDWREEGTNYWKQEEVTHHDLERASEQFYSVERVDILVTHDAPWNPVSASLDYHTNNRTHYTTGAPYFPQSAIDDSHVNRDFVTNLTHLVQPALHFHGHMHKSYDYLDTDIFSRTIGLDRDGASKTSHAVIVDIDPDGLMRPQIAEQRINALEQVTGK